jgi:putative ABC transport system permease protein
MPRGASDWALRIRRRAEATGVALPSETIDELAAHLEDVYLAARREGASEPDAHERADRALEESTLEPLRRHARQKQRDPRLRLTDDAAAVARSGRLAAVLYTLRAALRQLHRHWAFSLVVVAILGLCSGAAVAVYTIVDAVVLRPLPYRAPDRLVTLWATNAEKGLAHERLSPVSFMDYRELPAFSDAAAWWRPDVDLTDPGLDPVRVTAVETSTNLFEVLGIHPQVGPGFPDQGPLYSRDRTAVISDRLWRSRYGGDPGIVGSLLQLSGRAYTIVGVMPAGFDYPGHVDVWERLHWDLTQHSRGAHFMEAVARLAPGATLAGAETQVTALARRLAAEHADTNKAWGVRLVPLLEDQLGYYRPALFVLFGAAGLLLVIGCVNVASLLLTRALSRAREMAVRTALGASRLQILGQLLGESFLLSLVSAGAGLLVAGATIPLVVHATPVSIPRLEETTVEPGAFGFALLLVVLTTVFFGLVPTLVSPDRHAQADLRSGERGSSRATRRVYNLLVAGEVALAAALLIGSALLVRSVERMTQVRTGVDADDVVTASVQLPAAAYRTWGEVTEVHEALLQRLREAPGVTAAGEGSFLPLETGWRIPFRIEGEPPPRPEDAPQAQHESVTAGYFEALGARLRAGRWFTSHDTATSLPVVIVNQTFAERYLPGAAMHARLHTEAGRIGPLGQNLLPDAAFEVVGIVADVRNAPLGQPIEPAIYFPAGQFPYRGMMLTVRGRDAAAAVAAIRDALRQVAPDVPLASLQTWGERLRGRTAEPRLLRALLLGFGGLAGLLAATGVYGLFAWSVTRRRRELAIRVALGARPTSLAVRVLGRSTLLVGAGLAVGATIVHLSAGALERVLFGVTAGDPASTGAASGVLLAAALTACAIPALRAARTRPAEVLKGDE